MKKKKHYLHREITFTRENKSNGSVNKIFFLWKPEQKCLILPETRCIYYAASVRSLECWFLCLLNLHFCFNYDIKFYDTVLDCPRSLLPTLKTPVPKQFHFMSGPNCLFFKQQRFINVRARTVVGLYIKHDVTLMTVFFFRVWFQASATLDISLRICTGSRFQNDGFVF